MTTITTTIPARAEKSRQTGKVFSYPAYEVTFVRDDDGRWSGEYGPMLEADVIDELRRATNWDDIRAAHFPMHGYNTEMGI